MINPLRGEIAATLDGREWKLCLTLGALASLEHRLGASNLSDLASRFSSGNLVANDLISIIAAGLQGAGNDVSEDDVAMMQVEGGIAGYVEIAASLLNATFLPTDSSVNKGS